MDDYFAGSKPPGSPPPVPPPPPQAPTQWARDSAPPNPFGTPDQPSQWGAQPASPWGPQPPSPWAAQPASAGMSTLVKLLIALGVVVGLCIVAAVAIPVFLNGRGKSLSDRTTVSLPATVAGLALRTDAQAQQVVQPLRDVDAPGEHLVAAYGGVAQPEFVVMVTKYYMTDRDQRDYFTGVRKGAQSSAGLTLGAFSAVAAGTLGGTAECASAPLATMCVFADSGAYGLMISFGTREHALQLLPQVRTAVEHRS